MNNVFSVNVQQEFTIIEINLTSHDGVITPDMLKSMIEQAPAVPCDRGVVLNGRAPIWLMAALSHEYHPARWVATFDPRLGGAVVVSRHHKEAPQVGEVVPV